MARQTGLARGDLEVIVVDNGSTDGSVAMVEEEFGLSCGLPIRLVCNKENQGFCRANNRGMSAASRETRFFALLNNDAEAEPGWLDALRSALDARPDFGMAASKILVYDDPGRIDKVGHLIYPDGQNRGRGAGEIDHGQYDRLEDALWPDGCAALYRREMLDTIGGFDEDLFAYGDDAELGLRARIAGWGCVYVPGARVRHHRGSTLGINSMRRLELIERNRVLLAVKLFPWSLLWLNGAYYAARILAGIWASIRGRGETALYPGWMGKCRMTMALMRGDLSALRMVPRMWRKRKEISQIRKLTPPQVRDLILRYRISLKELSERSTAV